MLAKMYIDNTVMVLIFKIMSASNNDLLHKKCYLIWKWLGLRKSDLILFVYIYIIQQITPREWIWSKPNFNKELNLDTTQTINLFCDSLKNQPLTYEPYKADPSEHVFSLKWRNQFLKSINPFTPARCNSQ